MKNEILILIILLINIILNNNVKIDTKKFKLNKLEFENLKKETLELQNKLNYSLPEIKMECRKIPPSNPVPTNARRLRLSDIKVVMALGDSKTAGFSMVSLSSNIERRQFY
jgi:flagellar basal body rod protein FlgB